MSTESSPLFSQHERQFAGNRFVYPVVSRRSAGISIGVNLNPDKVCNFDCVYCQVDRTSQSQTRFVEMDRLLTELNSALELVTSGRIFESKKFQQTSPKLRRLNDIAFSGDGEPTTFRNFDQIMERSVEVKRKHGLDDVKMVLITNASMLHRAEVIRGLKTLDENNGQIWAKLDTGTAEYFQKIDRTPIKFSQILENITSAARTRPIVIQSLFMRVSGEPPPSTEQEAFCDRLNEITAAEGTISLVQIYTIARRPTESFVSPLANDEVDRLVALVRDRTGLAVQGYYGVEEST